MLNPELFIIATRKGQVKKEKSIIKSKRIEAAKPVLSV